MLPPDHDWSRHSPVIEGEYGIRYYDQNGTVPSVTSVLGWIFGYGGWAGFDPSSAAVITARRRGTAVHRACEILAKGGELRDSSVHPMIRPYVEQFRDFIDSTRFRAVASELRVVSKRYGYGGRIDLIGESGDGPMILDLKTTQDVWLAGYQLSAYKQALCETTAGHESRQRGTLILSEKAPDKWKLRAFDDSMDFQVFLSALNCFKVAMFAGRLGKALTAQ